MIRTPLLIEYVSDDEMCVSMYVYTYKIQYAYVLVGDSIYVLILSTRNVHHGLRSTQTFFPRRRKTKNDVLFSAEVQLSHKLMPVGTALSSFRLWQRNNVGYGSVTCPFWF